ncbi:hypothetical protein P9112_003811, partial [Eukaryota sp. TZLM1-RC]
MTNLNPPPPGVINEELISSSCTLKPEASIFDIQTITLSFKDILNIANLQPYTKVRHLKLDNNKIKTIENISHLILLESLDLSFNQIDTISGLENLVNITELRLFRNNLTSISNIEHLTKLRLLNVGKNKIATPVSEVSRFLRKFPCLRILMLTGNPLADDVSYRACVLAHCQKLRYLDYRLCHESEVRAAIDKFETEVKELMDLEKVESDVREQEEKEERERQIDEKSNCLAVRGLFSTLTTEDPDIKKIALIDGVEELMIDFEQNINLLVSGFRKDMINIQEAKDHEYKELQKSLSVVSHSNEEEALQLVAAFEEEKRIVLAKMKDVEDLPLEMEDLTALVSSFSEKNDTLNDELVELELELAEQNISILDSFDQHYDGLKRKAIDLILSWFGKLREACVDFSNQLSELIEKVIDAGIDEDNEEVNPDLLQLLNDRHALMSIVQNSKEFREIQLDNAETISTQNEEQLSSSLISRLRSSELERNRNRMEEIWRRKHLVEEELKIGNEEDVL